jgi:putative ABC transport system permease protein
MLLKRPGFLAVAVLTLALGIGANSAIFSFVKVALLDDLPYRDAGRLVVVWQDYQRRGGPEREWFSYPNFVDYRAQSRTLADMAVFSAGTFTLSGGGEPEAVSGVLVSPSTLSLLGVRFPVGRGFLASEGAPGAAPVVVLSHGLWQRRYSRDLHITGKKIVVDDVPATVVGVLPEGFEMPLEPDAALFMPLPPPALRPGARGNVTLRAIGRLAPGATLAQARADLNAVAQRIAQENADAPRDVGAAVYPLRDEMMGPVKPALVALLVAVVFVLLIACVNIANLLLARATARRGEIGLRAALGAAPRRLVRQILTESLFLALLGGALGILLAVAGVDILKRLAVSAAFPLPGLDAVHVDAGVLLFTLGLVTATGLLFGLAPALEIRRTDINRVLQGNAGGRSTAGRTGRLLVVCETALALVLLVGSGLMLRSLERLRQVDTGYNTSGVLVFQVQTPGTRYPEAHQVRAFYADLLARLSRLGGVASAGAVSSLPLGGSNTDARFRIEGRPADADPVSFWYRIITPGYLATSGLTVLQGRGITEHDQEGTPLVVVINKSTAQQYFPGESPVGKGLLTSRDRYEIVGVVRNARSFSLKTEEPPAVYFSHGQMAAREMGIAVRTQGDPRRMAGPIRAVLAQMDPAMAATDLRPLADLVDAAAAPERALGILIGAFGLLALLLAAVGLYGLMAYLTGQRTREVGIRMALGADSPRVLRLILAQALALSSTGLVLGLLAALVLSRTLQSMLFEISALDPISFAASAVLLTTITLLASYLPARRASRVDPATVLRT